MTAHEASSSSSSKSKLWKYDVYLSFSGEDTCKGFTGHLHDAIEDRGYKAYMDEDDLKRGEEIKEELYRGIEESRISIIVFSKSYADSSSCLDELVKIMECRSKLGRHVLPIFYNVDPSHVRKQNGDLAKAFQNYEGDIREEKDDKKREAKQERVNQWREALTEAANLAGRHLQVTDNRREVRFIKKIVEENIGEWLSRTDEVFFLSKLWNYDVYLSFSGVDTRDGFTGHLHAALKDRGYHAYMNEDDLSGGEEIKEEMFRAIEESRISIIVFSKSYADSSWCLDELVKIMECRSKLGKHVLPIFYYVNVSHVRKQDGDLAQAFQKHKEGILEEKDDKKREAKQEKVAQWKKALREAANLFGHHLQITDPGCEAGFIKKFIDENIRDWLPKTNELHVAKHPVGIKSCIQGIISDLSSGGSNDVHMVGIWGMGGLGKTTAAKAIYNQIHRKFEFKSFLANVSDATSKHGLVYLQEKLISDLLGQKFGLSSVGEGIRLIEDQFRHRRVLVIMDNIDNVEQLDAIVRSHDYFGPGSGIIITTRDEYLLRQVGVDKIYRLREMNEDEALALFSWHAFRKSYPIEEYIEVSEKVVSYCGGLPLALEVLGSFLFNRSVAEWKRYLEELKRIPSGLIIKPLRISFEGLDDTQKAIFLDISCFFIGRDKDYVAKVLDGCGFCATIGINVLHEQCLVTVEDNKLNMHKLLREMARVIISEKSPHHPGKWSRLWTRQEVIDVLTNKSGTRKIEGLALHLQSSDEASFSTKAFAKMKKLRLLDLSGVELNGEYKHLPKELIWFRWKLCPLKSMPDDFFNLDKLVVLEMHSSKLVQVWEGSKSIHNLKIFDLSCSPSLQKSPDFSQVPHLEELILEGCSSLSEIHPSIGHLKRLSLVNLRRCHNLCSLPRDFYKSKSVETLLLNGCEEFIELHEDIGEMISLRTLEAEETAIREVPPSIGHLKRLSFVNLRNCCSLSSLPRDFYKSKSVEILCLNGCSKLRELHEDIGEMISLRTLEAEQTAIKHVPGSIARLKNLTRLSIRFG